MVVTMLLQGFEGKRAQHYFKKQQTCNHWELSGSWWYRPWSPVQLTLSRRAVKCAQPCPRHISTCQ